MKVVRKQQVHNPDAAALSTAVAHYWERDCSAVAMGQNFFAVAKTAANFGRISADQHFAAVENCFLPYRRHQRPLCAQRIPFRGAGVQALERRVRFIDAEDGHQAR